MAGMVKSFRKEKENKLTLNICQFGFPETGSWVYIIALSDIYPKGRRQAYSPAISATKKVKNTNLKTN